MNIAKKYFPDKKHGVICLEEENIYCMKKFAITP